MAHNALIQLALIVVVGGVAQWLAWRVRMASILLLLTAGIVAGPLTGWLQPDALFGDLLLPLVSLSVAVILYEGGLNLKLRELHDMGGVLLRLLTLGTAVTWLVGTLAAHWLLGFDWPVATLLGSILVVTGPTVIGPILRHLRLRGRTAALLKWEGIVIDPLGAALAVLVFSVLHADALHVGVGRAALSLARTLVCGVSVGGLSAGVLIFAFRRFWIPDHLHNPGSLMLMTLAFTLSNVFQEESGLLAVTVMGTVLANQKWVSIRHVVDFKESLTILLISFLFIVLAARLQPAELRGFSLETLAFVAVLILIARPAAVLAATLGSKVTGKERVFLSLMAPRGIVAAAVVAVFALRLQSDGHPRAGEMVPATLLTVFVTGLLYSSIATPLARRLGLVQANPQGILFIGANDGVRNLAAALQTQGCPVFLVDTDRENVSRARMASLPCLHGSALAVETREAIDYGGLGRMLAMTPSHEVNSLCCDFYGNDFGRKEVYQLALPHGKDGRHQIVTHEHQGRQLFSPELTYSEIHRRIACGGTVKTTKLTQEFDYTTFQARSANVAVPLFLLRPTGIVSAFTTDASLTPAPGDLVISLVAASDGPGAAS